MQRLDTVELVAKVSPQELIGRMGLPLGDALRLQQALSSLQPWRVRVWAAIAPWLPVILAGVSALVGAALAAHVLSEAWTAKYNAFKETRDARQDDVGAALVTGNVDEERADADTVRAGQTPDSLVMARWLLRHGQGCDPATGRRPELCTKLHALRSSNRALLQSLDTWEARLRWIFLWRFFGAHAWNEIGNVVATNLPLDAANFLIMQRRGGREPTSDLRSLHLTGLDEALFVAVVSNDNPNLAPLHWLRRWHPKTIKRDWSSALASARTKLANDTWREVPQEYRNQFQAWVDCIHI